MLVYRVANIGEYGRGTRSPAQRLPNDFRLSEDDNMAPSGGWPGHDWPGHGWSGEDRDPYKPHSSGPDPEPWPLRPHYPPLPPSDGGYKYAAIAVVSAGVVSLALIVYFCCFHAAKKAKAPPTPVPPPAHPHQPEVRPTPPLPPRVPILYVERVPNLSLSPPPPSYPDVRRPDAGLYRLDLGAYGRHIRISPAREPRGLRVVPKGPAAPPDLHMYKRDLYGRAGLYPSAPAPRVANLYDDIYRKDQMRFQPTAGKLCLENDKLKVQPSQLPSRQKLRLHGFNQEMGLKEPSDFSASSTV